MWEVWIRLLESLLISAIGAGGAVQFLITRYDKKKEKREKHISNSDKLLLAIAQDRIVYLCDHALKSGEINSDTKAVIEDMFAPYEANGGNNRAHVKVEAMRELPVRD